MRRRGKQLLALSLAGIILASSGCQKTPDEDIVVNKNEGVFEEKLKEKKEEGDQKAPEQFKDSFENDGKDVKITVDAPVSVIESNTPVLRVRPHQVTAEEAKHWADVLFEGETAYEPVTQLSKKEISEEILRLKKRAGDKEALMEEYKDEEAVQGLVDSLNDKIKLYEKEYQKAPDVVKKEKCDWTFKPYTHYFDEGRPYEECDELDNMSKTKELQATAKVNEQTALISATNRDEKDFSLHNLAFYYTSLLGDETVVPYKEFSEEEAVAIAEDIREKLNLKDWKLTTAMNNSREGRCEYIMWYSPKIGDLPVISTSVDLKSEDLFASNYPSTELRITVTNGIVEGVELTSAIEILKEENENVNTITFEEAFNLFRTHVQTKYTPKSFVPEGQPLPEGARKAEMKVTKIQQGMMRVKEKNNKNEYLMIPVWVFGGSSYYDGNKWADQDFCTLNAVDGSVIDTSLGY